MPRKKTNRTRRTLDGFDLMRLIKLAITDEDAQKEGRPQDPLLADLWNAVRQAMNTHARAEMTRAVDAAVLELQTDLYEAYRTMKTRRKKERKRGLDDEAYARHAKKRSQQEKAQREAAHKRVRDVIDAWELKPEPDVLKKLLIDRQKITNVGPRRLAEQNAALLASKAGLATTANPKILRERERTKASVSVDVVSAARFESFVRSQLLGEPDTDGSSAGNALAVFKRNAMLQGVVATERENAMDEAEMFAAVHDRRETAPSRGVPGDKAR